MKTKFACFGFSLLAVTSAALLAYRSLAGTVTYTYDPAGRLISGNYGGATNIVYAYDPAGNLLLTSSPVPALVLGQPADGHFTLAWPASPSGFVLQQSPALGAAADWTAANLPVVASGNWLAVTIPIGPETTFYRLARP